MLLQVKILFQNKMVLSFLRQPHFSKSIIHMTRTLILISFLISSCSFIETESVDERLREYNYVSAKKVALGVDEPEIIFDINSIEKERSAETMKIFTKRRYIQLITPSNLIIGLLI